MIETNSDESLRVLLRLLIDDIVEDLSRSGPGEAGVRKSDGFMPLVNRTRFPPAWAFRNARCAVERSLLGLQVHSRFQFCRDACWRSGSASDHNPLSIHVPFS